MTITPSDAAQGVARAVLALIRLHTDPEGNGADARALDRLSASLADLVDRERIPSAPTDCDGAAEACFDAIAGVSTSASGALKTMTKGNRGKCVRAMSAAISGCLPSGAAPWPPIDENDERAIDDLVKRKSLSRTGERDIGSGAAPTERPSPASHDRDALLRAACKASGREAMSVGEALAWLGSLGGTAPTEPSADYWRRRHSEAETQSEELAAEVHRLNELIRELEASRPQGGAEPGLRPSAVVVFSPPLGSHVLACRDEAIAYADSSSGLTYFEANEVRVPVRRHDLRADLDARWNDERDRVRARELEAGTEPAKRPRWSDALRCLGSDAARNGDRYLTSVGYIEADAIPSMLAEFFADLDRASDGAAPPPQPEPSNTEAIARDGLGKLAADQLTGPGYTIEPHDGAGGLAFTVTANEPSGVPDTPGDWLLGGERVRVENRGVGLKWYRDDLHQWRPVYAGGACALSGDTVTWGGRCTPGDAGLRGRVEAEVDFLTELEHEMTRDFDASPSARLTHKANLLNSIRRLRAALGES